MEIKGKHHVNIGTIGHVDHGKTSLTAAIQKTLDGERLTEEELGLNDREKGRGITINFASSNDGQQKRTIQDQTMKRHQLKYDKARKPIIEPDEDQM